MDGGVAGNAQNRIYPNIKMQVFGIQEVFVFNAEAQTRVDVDIDDGTQRNRCKIFICVLEKSLTIDFCFN